MVHVMGWRVLRVNMDRFGVSENGFGYAVWGD